jgi:hypothetical protein
MLSISNGALKVSYLGTNVGKIYLSDVRKRLGLGGAQEGDWYGGQDEYIIWGETKLLLLTGDVETSSTSGILAHFSDATNTSWSALNGPPLVLTITDYNIANVVGQIPSVMYLTGAPGVGGTGLGYAWSDEYLARLSNDKYAPASGVSGALRSGETGYYYGNSI